MLAPVHRNLLPPGTHLKDRYKIERPLGKGGFGATYKGHDRLLACSVAIKEYLPQSIAARDPGAVEVHMKPEDTEAFLRGLNRFVQEARLLGLCRTKPRVVSVFDFFEANGTAYIVMEYVRGQTLAALQKAYEDGRIPFKDLKTIVNEVLETLHDIHGSGLLHLDLTPNNIILTEAGHIRLIDFGAARSLEVSEGADHAALGRHGFAPMEQYARDGRVGAWTDLYAVGATLYSLLTNRDPPGAFDRVPNDPLVPPSRLGVALSRGVEQAILKALAPNPMDRFQSAEALRTALGAEPDVPYNPQAAQKEHEPPLCLGGLLEEVALEEASPRSATAPAQPGSGSGAGSPAVRFAPPGALLGSGAGQRPDGNLADIPIATIAEALRKHQRYLDGKRDGVRLILSMRNLSGLSLTGRSFTRAELVGCSFAGSNLRGANFRETNLFCADFRYADIRGADFRKADLRGARFDHANLGDALFDKADCREGLLFVQKSPGNYVDSAGEMDRVAASFVRTNLAAASFRGTDLTRAKLMGAVLDQASFAGAVLDQADLSKAHLRATDFENASLSDALFYGADIAECDTQELEDAGARLFERVANVQETVGHWLQSHRLWTETFARDGKQMHVQGLDLSDWCAEGLDLSVAVFERVKLSGVSFRTAKLPMATFRHCDLSGADLSFLDARGIQLIDCTLREARLTDGNFSWIKPITESATQWASVFSRCDLSGASLERSRFDKARFDETNLSNARLPPSIHLEADLSTATTDGAVTAAG